MNLSPSFHHSQPLLGVQGAQTTHVPIPSFSTLQIPILFIFLIIIPSWHFLSQKKVQNIWSFYYLICNTSASFCVTSLVLLFRTISFLEINETRILTTRILRRNTLIQDRARHISKDFEGLNSLEKNVSKKHPGGQCGLWESTSQIFFICALKCFIPIYLCCNISAIRYFFLYLSFFKFACPVEMSSITSRRC